MNKNNKHRHVAYAAIVATVAAVGAHQADAAIVVDSYYSQLSAYAEATSVTPVGDTVFHGNTDGKGSSLSPFHALAVAVESAPTGAIANVAVQSLERFDVSQDLSTSGSYAGSGRVELGVNAGCISVFCSSGYAEGHLRSEITFTITDTSYNYDFTTSHDYAMDGSVRSGEGIFSLLNPSEADTMFSSSWASSAALSDGPDFHDSGLLLPGTYKFSWVTNGSFRGLSSPGGGFIDADFRFELAPVPLPAAAWLLLSGLGGLAAVARRRRPAAGTA